MPTPYTPLSDASWEALLPHLHRTPSTPGRPIENLRARFDALFAAVTSGKRWSHYTAPVPTPTETLHRHFRRLTHAGLWTRLLTALADPNCPEPIKAIAHAIHGAYRRTIRLLGLPAITLARRLNLTIALPAPPRYFPDQDLSEKITSLIPRLLKTLPDDQLRPLFPLFYRLHRLAGGLLHIPAWARRL